MERIAPRTIFVSVARTIFVANVMKEMPLGVCMDGKPTMRGLSREGDMSLKRDECWWIENKHGILVTVGREMIFHVIKGATIRDVGMPNPQRTKYWAKHLCRKGERPVKVKIVKVGK